MILFKSDFPQQKEKLVQISEKEKITDEQALARTLPQGTELLKKIRDYKRIDFSALQLLPLDFDVETNTCLEKV